MWIDQFSIAEEGVCLDNTGACFLYSLFSHPQCIHFTEVDKNIVISAYIVAIRAHGLQFRKSKSPYITHVENATETYLNLARGLQQPISGNDIAAMLLHDVVEDHPEHLPLILEKFSPSLVCEVLDMSKNRLKPEIQKILSDYIFHLSRMGQNEQAEIYYEYLGRIRIDPAIFKEQVPDSVIHELTRDFMIPEQDGEEAKVNWELFFKKKAKDLYLFFMPPESFIKKCADRFDNIIDFDALTDEKIIKNIASTKFLYIERARQLWLFFLVQKLEQACLVCEQELRKRNVVRLIWVGLLSPVPSKPWDVHWLARAVLLGGSWVRY